MTSQVILVNRECIVVASDSVVTVRDNESNVRTSPHSEKIYEVRGHKVAIVHSGNSSLGGIPIEALVSEWESTLSLALPNVEDYSSSFIKWLGKVNTFERLGSTWDSLEEIIDKMVYPFWERFDQLNRDVADSEEKSKQQSTAFTDVAGDALWREYYSGASQAWAKRILDKYFDEVARRVEWWFQAFDLENDLKDQIFSYLYRNLGKMGGSNVTLAFVGYGVEQLVPAFETIYIKGVLEGVIFASAGRSYTWKNSSSRTYHFLAQAEAPVSLLFGIDSDVRWHIADFVSDKVIEIADALDGDIDEDVVYDAFYGSINGALDLHENTEKLLSTAIYEKFEKVRSKKLLDLIGASSKIELALLASMFVSVQSLMSLIDSTQPSVGGPIDVAVIDKREGFRWYRHKGVSGGTHNFM